MTAKQQHGFNRVINAINKHVKQQAIPYFTFGIFGVITYPLYYFVWLFTTPNGYENLYLRLLAIVLCVPLILYKKWPVSLKQFLTIYWYSVILYALPFLFTFLLLKNNFSFISTLNTLAALALTILLLDFFALIIVLPTGIIAGWLLFISFNKFIPPNNVFAIIACYLSFIIFGTVFAKHRDLMQRAETIKFLSANLAHEFRTSLRTISSYINGLKKYLPDLLTSYKAAKTTKLDIPTISPQKYAILETSLNDMENEVRSMFLTIDILLQKQSSVNDEEKA